MSKTLQLLPRVSEKAYGLSQKSQTYVFDVPTSANKMMIASAVKAQFNVEVTNVNMLISKGKAITTNRKGGKKSMGRKADIKKAYVTLKKGDSIPIFASEDKADKKKAASKGKK